VGFHSGNVGGWQTFEVQLSWEIIYERSGKGGQISATKRAQPHLN
jgi:hypothetical protein